MQEIVKVLLFGAANVVLSVIANAICPAIDGVSVAFLGGVIGGLLGGGGSGMITIPEPPKAPAPLPLQPISVLPTTGVQPVYAPMTAATPGAVKNYGALQLVTPAGEQLAAANKTKQRSAAYTAKKVGKFEKRTGQKAGFQYGTVPEAVTPTVVTNPIQKFGGTGDFYQGQGAVQPYSAQPIVNDFVSQLLGITQAPRPVGPTSSSYQQARERFLSRIFV